MRQLVQRLFADLAVGARLESAHVAGDHVPVASTVHLTAFSLGADERIVDLLQDPRVDMQGVD